MRWPTHARFPRDRAARKTGTVLPASRNIGHITQIDLKNVCGPTNLRFFFADINRRLMMVNYNFLDFRVRMYQQFLRSAGIKIVLTKCKIFCIIAQPLMFCTFVRISHNFLYWSAWQKIRGENWQHCEQEPPPYRKVICRRTRTPPPG